MAVPDRAGQVTESLEAMNRLRQEHSNISEDTWKIVAKAFPLHGKPDDAEYKLGFYLGRLDRQKDNLLPGTGDIYFELLNSCLDVLKAVPNQQGVERFLEILRATVVGRISDEIYYPGNSREAKSLSPEQAQTVLNTFKVQVQKLAEFLKTLTLEQKFDQKEIDGFIFNLGRYCLGGKLEMDHISSEIKFDSMDKLMGAIMIGQVKTAREISINLDSVTLPAPQQPALLGQ